MSVEAVAEVQVVKGVLPRGIRRLDWRSGQHDHAFGDEPVPRIAGCTISSTTCSRRAIRSCPPTTAKPEIRFNQFGGSLGGPILQNRLLFFTTYEGYREKSGVTRQGNVAHAGDARSHPGRAAVSRDQTRARHTAAAERADQRVIGQYDGRQDARSGATTRSWAKWTSRPARGRLSVTASRMRPFARVPSSPASTTISTLHERSKRVSTNYVVTTQSWVSESRFGWNRNTLDRFDAFWLAESPTRGAQADLYNVRKRIGELHRVGLVQQRQIPKSSH